MARPSVSAVGEQAASEEGVVTLMRDRVLGMLQRVPAGASLGHILGELNINPHSEEGSAVEALLFLSPEVRLIDGRWRVVELARRDRILAAIEAYASTTGKRLFRVVTALDGLPLKDQPTVDELREVLASSNDRYTLLPNAMIKRNH
jgi:hypothetical protein